MTHNELIDVAYTWVMKRCGVAFREFKTLNTEIPDVIGFRSGESLVVEVKVSRSDFLSDKKKMCRNPCLKHMGKFRFYLCPSGLIKPEELPENWGLVYVNESKKTRIIHNPYSRSLTGNIWHGGHDVNLMAEHMLMYSALRRLHLRGRIEEVYEPLRPNREGIAEY